MQISFRWRKWGAGRIVNWSNLLFPAYCFCSVRSCGAQASRKHINSPAPQDNTYSQVNVLFFHFLLTLMEGCLPGCKIHHLAFQNIPLWISLLLMPGFIEMEIMGTPVGRGSQVNALSLSMLAEMGQLSCWFPQPPASCSNVELLFHAFYQNRHVCWGFASCHVEGTDVSARNVKEFPSILLDSAPWRFVLLLRPSAELPPLTNTPCLSIWRV